MMADKEFKSPVRPAARPAAGMQLPGTPSMLSPKGETKQQTGSQAGYGAGAGAGVGAAMAPGRASDLIARDLFIDDKDQAADGSTASDSGSSRAKQDALSKRKARVELHTEVYTRLTAVSRRNADFMLAFAMLGLLGMVVQNELAWVWNTQAGYGAFCPDPTDSSCDPRVTGAMLPVTEGLVVLNAIRALVTLSTVILLFFCYRFYASVLAARIAQHMLPPTATLLGCGLRWQFLLELCVWSVHIFPGIESASNSPSLYLLVTLPMFLRLLLIARTARYHSSLLTNNGRFIGALTNVRFSSAFILKTALKHRPAPVMLGCLLGLLLAAGYSIRMIDSLICVSQPALQCIPISFWDAEWMLVITILTVGYGDFVPHSHAARAVAVVGGLMGTLITAIIIALTTSYLQLSRSESRVVTFLKRDRHRKSLRSGAAKAIQAFFRYYTTPHDAKKAKARVERHLYSSLATFRHSRRVVSSTDTVSPADRQIGLLETMEVNVDDIKAHVELLGGYLLGVQDMVPGASPTTNPATSPGTPKFGSASWSPRVKERRQSTTGVSAGDGALIQNLADGVERLSVTLGSMQRELQDLQEAVRHNADDTRRRLARIEATVFAGT